MATPKLPAVNSLREWRTRRFLAAAFCTLLALPACSVNVKKDAQGEEKKVDIETPVGGIHVSKDADVADVGLPVYPGARKKEKDERGHEGNANVNISAGVFGLRVIAVEYVSDDPPEKLVRYYKDQLKKFGGVLECHTSHHGGEAVANRGGSDELKCEGDNTGKVVELKVGTKQNQHMVSIEPAESGKGTDFGLVYVQMRGKETI